MSDQLATIVVGAVLLLHGLGHGGALGAIVWIAARPGTKTGGWTAARSWLLPGLSPRSATMLASAFWITSLVGFVGAALALWGILLPLDTWRPLADVAAVVSLVGIFLFLGDWPIFNTVAAVVVDVAVLVAVLVLDWPPTVSITGT